MNNNIHFSDGNLVCKTNEEVGFLTFSLPSRSTCPYATEMCKKRCFAKKNESFKAVRASRERNLEETKKDTFIQDTIDILEKKLSSKKYANKKLFIRIHTSGDFYNKNYMKKWIQISDYFKGNNRIFLQAYTKSVIYIKQILDEEQKALDDINIHFCYSIWDDTDERDIELANELNLQTFTSLTKEDFLIQSEDKAKFLCTADCSTCQECYKNDGQNVIIKIH